MAWGAVERGAGRDRVVSTWPAAGALGSGLGPTRALYMMPKAPTPAVCASGHTNLPRFAAEGETPGRGRRAARVSAPPAPDA